MAPHRGLIYGVGMGLKEDVSPHLEALSDGKLDWRDAVAVAKLLGIAGILLLQLIAVLGGPSEAPAPEEAPAMETDSE